jgi:hypothetical protein
VCALEWCWAAGTTYPVLDFFANVIRNECRPVRAVVALKAGNVHGLCAISLFVWLVADGWCWFLLREKYCWLVADGWFVVR